jgi:hypothetical protein
MFKRFIASLVCFTFIFSNFQYVHAQDFSINQLPVAGSMIFTTPAYVPLALKGLIVHPENALKFDFLMDTGHSNLKGSDLSDEALKIMKYFLTALTIPEDDLWVNLSPYEKGRIIQNNFGQTIMGRDLLAQDYILKQLTASLIYPEKALGKEFWRQVYSKAAKEYGTTQIPVNTFNKVWIVPSEAVVWEHEGKVLIVKSRLKVMLEEDYLSLSKHQSQPGDMFNQEQQKNVSPSTLPSELGLNAKAPQVNNGSTSENVHALASNIVRAIVLPVLEKEVNEGKNFAQLRQMYQAMILATWYKKALKESILNKIYADKSKIQGLTPTRGHVIKEQQNVSPSTLPSELGLNTKATQRNEPNDVEAIYQQYLKAFKKGVFNYIKEDIDPSTGGTIPRKYFSGGFSLASPAMINKGTSFAKTVLTVLTGAFLTLSVLQQQAIAQAADQRTGGQTIVVMEKTVAQTQTNKKPIHPQVKSKTRAPIPAFKLIPEKEVIETIEKANAQKNLTADPNFLYASWALINNDKVFAFLRSHFAYHRTDRKNSMSFDRAITDFFLNPDHANLDEARCLLIFVQIEGYKKDRIPLPDKDFLDRETIKAWNEAMKRHSDGKDQSMLSPSAQETPDAAMQSNVDHLVNNLANAKGQSARDRIYQQITNFQEKLDSLKGSLEIKKDDLRLWAVKRLGQTGNIEAIEPLLEGLKGKYGEVVRYYVEPTLRELNASIETNASIEDKEKMFHIYVTALRSNDVNAEVIEVALEAVDNLANKVSESVRGTAKDMAMFGFLSDWRKKNEALIKKHFSKMGVQDTLSELDKHGYADPFYKAGSEKIDQLLKWDKDPKGKIYDIFREKNKELIRQYFLNLIVLPAEYKNNPDVVRQLFFAAIFTKLKDPKYPNSFKVLCVNILGDPSYNHSRAMIILNYINILESYGWQEDAPQWLIRDALGKNGAIVNELEEYKLRTDARDILRRNDVNEIINNLQRGSFSDVLKKRIVSLTDQEKKMRILEGAWKVPSLRIWAREEIYQTPVIPPEILRKIDLPSDALFQTPYSDRAALAAKAPGGIALNAKMLDLKIKRDGNGVPLSISRQPLDEINIQGFVPQIISIQPVDLSSLFGLNS